MRKLALWIALLLSATVPGAARDLEVYFIDVEGGQATLIVSPSGESMLIDAGWPGFDGRDAGRIVAAAKRVGLKRIDYMVVSHYHLDHVGGVAPLAEQFPIVHYVDHGPNTETGKQAEALSAAYEKVRAQGKHIVVKAGDRIPMRGLDIEVVAARGDLIAAPLKGAGAPNAACAQAGQKGEDRSENARSIGFVLRHGSFRFLNLSDLTWNKELELVCPNNLIGTVDVFLVNHHGLDASNPPPLVQAVRPQVAIMNNGARKGGSLEAWRAVRNSPGLEDLWQLHYAVKAGQDGNSPEELIANLDEKCEGHWLKLTARADGSFSVTNGRTNFTRTYKQAAKGR